MSNINQQPSLEEIDKSLTEKCMQCFLLCQNFETEPTTVSMQKFDVLIVQLRNVRFEYVDFMNRLKRTEPSNELILEKIIEVQNNITLLEKSIFQLEDTRRYYQIKIFNDTNMSMILQSLFSNVPSTSSS